MWFESRWLQKCKIAQLFIFPEQVPSYILIIYQNRSVLVCHLPYKVFWRTEYFWEFCLFLLIFFYNGRKIYWGSILPFSNMAGKILILFKPIAILSLILTSSRLVRIKIIYWEEQSLLQWLQLPLWGDSIILYPLWDHPSELASPEARGHSSAQINIWCVSRHEL